MTEVGNALRFHLATAGVGFICLELPADMSPTPTTTHRDHRVHAGSTTTDVTHISSPIRGTFLHVWAVLEAGWSGRALHFPPR